MKSFAANLFLVAALVIAAGREGVAQPLETLRYYGVAYRTVANNYRLLVRQHLQLEERTILDRIEFRYLTTQNIVAQAYISPEGTRVIEVSFGFLVIMENLAGAYALSTARNIPSCFDSYLLTTSEILERNTSNRGFGAGMEPVPLFPYYLAYEGAGCDGLSDTDIRNAEIARTVAGIMDSIMAVLVGHEIAHHILGHVDDGPGSVEESRANETAADIWAIQHSFRVGVLPLPAIPMWTFFAAAGGADMAAELQSTHPLGIRRFADAVDQIYEWAGSPAYEAEFGRPMPEDMLDELGFMANTLRDLVPR